MGTHPMLISIEQSTRIERAGDTRKRLAGKKKGVRFSVQTFSDGNAACRIWWGRSTSGEPSGRKGWECDVVRSSSIEPREAQNSQRGRLTNLSSVYLLCWMYQRADPFLGILLLTSEMHHLPSTPTVHHLYLLHSPQDILIYRSQPPALTERWSSVQRIVAKSAQDREETKGCSDELTNHLRGNRMRTTFTFFVPG